MTTAPQRVLHLVHDALRFDLTEAGPDDGELVILLHGFPQTRRCWDGIIPVLADRGYHVLAPDQRGYSPGARPTRRSAYRMDRLVGDVLAFARAVGAGRFHVVGHDWGGAVAWALAADEPGRLLSMTSLATPHPRALVRSMASSDQAARSWYMALFQVPGLAERMIAAAGGRFFAGALERTGLDRARAEQYVAALRRPGAARAALAWYRTIPFSGGSTIGDARVPTLYVYGRGDTALGRRAADLTEEHVDAPYRYEILEGASHWLPEQSADDVLPVLLDHFASHPA